jgi:hypothetical protein
MGEYSPPALANSSVLLAIALKCAVAVWIIEVPILLADSIVVAIVFSAGWLIIFAYTFYRAWHLQTSALLNYGIGVIRFIGSVLAIALATAVLYLTFRALSSPAASGPIWQFKAAFISNMFAALDAATVAMLGIFLTERICAMVSSHKS